MALLFNYWTNDGAIIKVNIVIATAQNVPTMEHGIQVKAQKLLPQLRNPLLKATKPSPPS